MLQDYITSILHHIETAQAQFCWQTPTTTGDAIKMRKDNISKDADYLIEALKSMVATGKALQDYPSTK